MLVSIFMKLFHILSLHFITADVKSHFLYAFVNREKIFSENKKMGFECTSISFKATLIDLISDFGLFILIKKKSEIFENFELFLNLFK